ncbi:lipopolysaccharide kinase InaA family protein [Candidatus Hydrogenedentota bacterium]
MSTLPEDFERIAGSKVEAWVRSGLVDTFKSLDITDPEAFWNKCDSGEAVGRAPVRLLCISGSEPCMAVVRKYRRGGLFGKLVSDTYFIGARPHDELVVTAHAERSGAPVPRVLAAVKFRKAIGYGGFLVTEEIARSEQLPTRWKAAKSRSEQCSLIRATARAVRQLHDTGIYHADLQLKNILISEDGNAHIIDCDRARVVDPSDVFSRVRNLLRFLRSARKAARKGLVLSDRDIKLFLAFYTHENIALRDEISRYRILPVLYKLKWALSDVMSLSQ